MHILDPDPGRRYRDLHVRRGGERHAGRRTQRGKIRKKNKQERELRKEFGCLNAFIPKPWHFLYIRV